MNEVRLSIQSVDISWQYKPLSIVVSIGVSSVVSSVAVVESRVSVGEASISVGGVEEGGISLGLGLGLSISRSREKRE